MSESSAATDAQRKAEVTGFPGSCEGIFTAPHYRGETTGSTECRRGAAEVRLAPGTILSYLTPAGSPDTVESGALQTTILSMKISLCILLLAALPPSLLLAQGISPPAPPASDPVRETKSAVLQRHLEAALDEKLEIEKQLLTAPADQQEQLKVKAAALAKFSADLERDLRQLMPPGRETQLTPAPADRPGLDTLRKAAREQLTNIQRRRAEKNSALRTGIAKLREAAAVSLKQLAGSSDAAASTALLAEARRLATIEPEAPLSQSQALHSLDGVWEHGLSPFRKSVFAANGCVLQMDGTPHGTWTWLDEAQGLFFVDDIPSQWMNLCRIANAEAIGSVVMNGAQFTYTRKAAVALAPLALPAGCDVMTKLEAAEKSLREEAAVAWQEEARKVTAALDSIAHELPEPDRSEYSLTITRLQLEKCFQPKVEPTPALTGKWITDGRTLEFTSGGVVQVNGEPKGKWLWGKSRSRENVVFTLGAGQLTAVGRLDGSGDSMELLLIGGEAKHAMKQ